MRFNDVDEVSRQHFMRKQWLTELMIQFIDDMGNPSNRKCCWHSRTSVIKLPK